MPPRQPAIGVIARRACLIAAMVLIAASSYARGETVQVNGHCLHIAITEPAQRTTLPTLVFESGLGDVGTEGWGHVLPLLSSSVRVVRYDRPGLGKSEPDGQSPTPRHIAAVLHDALAQAHVSPPYILIGHSFGGPRIRMFAAVYPEEVAGLVFVDPTDFTSTPQDTMREVFAPLGLGQKESDEMDAAVQRARANSRVPPSVQPEFDMASAMEKSGFQDFRDLPPLRDIAVVVLVSESIVDLPASLPVSFDLRRFDMQWMKARVTSLAEFTASLPHGTFVATPNSGHYIQSSEPDLVVWAINRVLNGQGRPSPSVH